MILMVGVTRKNAPVKNAPVIIYEVDRVESPPVCTNLLQLLKLPLYTPVLMCVQQGPFLCAVAVRYTP